MLDHLSIQCAYLSASAAFYDAVLAPLGITRVHTSTSAIGYGVQSRAEFWIGVKSGTDGFREAHLAFAAATRQAVDEFYGRAVEVGAEVLHSPRLWPQYHAAYYGAFVRDPDGNNVEAVCHTPL